MAYVDEIGIGEIDRDMSRIRRKRQGLVGLLGQGSDRRHVDYRRVVGSRDGHRYGLYGGTAVIVGNRDVVGQNRRR